MKPSTEVIIITVNNPGGRTSLSYTNNGTTTAHPGDEIEWEADYQFGVVFGLTTPLDGAVYVSGKARGKKKIKVKIRDKAVHGTYKYTVALHDGTSLVLDDPQIIIN